MKKNKKTKGVITVIVLILIATAIGSYIFLNGGVSAEQAKVEKGQVIKLLKETGTVESEHSITISAKTGGEIKGLSVSEGDPVRTGDLLMTSNGASAELSIKSMQAELSGLRVQYKQARDLAGKNKTLYEQGALSYEVYNTSNTLAKQLSAQISALTYSIDSFAESSGGKGVKSPIDGVITEIYVEEGENIMAGVALFEISNINQIYVKTDFIAEDADLIKVGDPVKIYNEDGGFLDENGKVKKIHLKAQDKMSDLGVNQKRVTVEISFGQNINARLGSNMDVEITIEKVDNVIRISDLAVFEKNKKDYVYVIENGKAVLRQIQIGLKGEDYFEITNGLAVGETIIISPGDDISEGVKIKTN